MAFLPFPHIKKKIKYCVFFFSLVKISILNYVKSRNGFIFVRLSKPRCLLGSSQGHMVHLIICHQHMDKWRVWECRDVGLWLLSLSRISDSLLGQGAGWTNTSVFNSVHSVAIQAQLSSQGWAGWVSLGLYWHKILSNLHPRLWEEVTSNFCWVQLDRVPLGHFQNHSPL